MAGTHVVDRNRALVDGSGHDGSSASDAEAVVHGHQERTLVGSIRQESHPLQGLDQLVQTWTNKKIEVVWWHRAVSEAEEEGRGI